LRRLWVLLFDLLAIFTKIRSYLHIHIGASADELAYTGIYDDLDVALGCFELVI